MEILLHNRSCDYLIKTDAPEECAANIEGLNFSNLDSSFSLKSVHEGVLNCQTGEDLLYLYTVFCKAP